MAGGERRQLQLCLLFHALAFVTFSVCSYRTYIIPTALRFGQFSFLTFWAVCLQTIYYGLCTVKNLVTDRQRSAQLQRWRDNMHASLAFPVGMFVVVTFWALYAVDRELVFPKKLDKFVPFWLNHMLHTAVFPFLMMDKFLVNHQYPRRSSGMLGACSLALIYLAWILFIAYYENFWVYPILEVLQIHERAIFILLCLAFFCSFYVLGEAITKFLWRNQVQVKASKMK